MKVTEQYFPVVLFIMLCKMALTLEFVDETLNFNPLSESYWAVLSCGAVYYTVQSGSNFWAVDRVRSSEGYWLQQCTSPVLLYL